MASQGGWKPPPGQQRLPGFAPQDRPAPQNPEDGPQLPGASSVKDTINSLNKSSSTTGTLPISSRAPPSFRNKPRMELQDVAQMPNNPPNLPPPLPPFGFPPAGSLPPALPPAPRALPQPGPPSLPPALAPASLPPSLGPPPTHSLPPPLPNPLPPPPAVQPQPLPRPNHTIITPKPQSAQPALRPNQTTIAQAPPPALQPQALPRPNPVPQPQPVVRPPGYVAPVLPPRNSKSKAAAQLSAQQGQAVVPFEVPRNEDSAVRDLFKDMNLVGDSSTLTFASVLGWDPHKNYPYKMHIIEHDLREEGAGVFCLKYVMYEIHCTNGSEKWIIHRRFQQCFDLNVKLKEQRLLPYSDDTLPPKHAGQRDNTAEGVSERRIGLQKWLDRCCVESRIRNSPYFFNFAGPYQMGDVAPDMM